ncbi:MAG: SIS domain-containing protein [Acidobacteria bacterium]|nr:SIS domain-containing protein [Acidobacteriota bacterium]
MRAIFAQASTVHLATAERSTSAMSAAADAMIAALARHNKILTFGNGGSAADAQHVAAELVGRFQRNRQALAAMALTTDTSIITSIANDVAYEQVFVRQIEAMGRPGDVAFGISTSGRSPNVLAALARARELQLTTIALVGPRAEAVADIVIPVAADSTARIQEAHRTALHAICELVEETFAGA